MSETPKELLPTADETKRVLEEREYWRAFGTAVGFQGPRAWTYKREAVFVSPTDQSDIEVDGRIVEAWNRRAPVAATEGTIEKCRYCSGRGYTPDPYPLRHPLRPDRQRS